jgi:hypothetical protein
VHNRNCSILAATGDAEAFRDRPGNIDVDHCREVGFFHNAEEVFRTSHNIASHLEEKIGR